MPSLPDSTQAVSILPLRSFLLIIGMIAAGFSLTLYVFYPGVMTYDARYVYDDIAKGTLGDWQSPVMTLLWSLIDPIVPGSASMGPSASTLSALLVQVRRACWKRPWRVFRRMSAWLFSLATFKPTTTPGVWLASAFL